MKCTWKAYTGPENAPGEEYDWVLVKIRDSLEYLPNSTQEIYNLPMIAEYRNGAWYNRNDEILPSKANPFEVAFWSPIDNFGGDVGEVPEQKEIKIDMAFNQNKIGCTTCVYGGIPGFVEPCSNCIFGGAGNHYQPRKD